MAEALSEHSNPTCPHHLWATQHLVKGCACDSTDKDQVYHTLHHALPQFVIGLLPKKSRYGADFTGLCKDIGDIPAWELYKAWQHETTLSRLKLLSLSPPAPDPLASYTPRSRRSPGPSVSRGTSVPPSTPNPSALSSFSSSSLQVASQGQQISFADPLQTPSTLSSTAPIQRPVFGSANRQAPPHLSALLQQVTQGTTPAATTMISFTARRVRDTPADKARYNGERLAWLQQFEGQLLSLAKPFPLSPGTFEQTRSVCVKCGRGEHKAINCKVEPAQQVLELKRAMRGALLHDLNKAAHASRARTVPGTPSPPTCTWDVLQLELSEPEDKAYYTDLNDSENE